MEHPRAYGVDESGERDREWMAGEFVTRGSRRQRNSVSWPDERAAMLDRTVIDRGLGGGERKPRRCHLARGTAGCSNEISIPSRGSSCGRSGLSAACEIGRSYVSLPETAGRPSLHKRNAKFVARSPARSLVRARARARSRSRSASLAWPRSTRDVAAPPTAPHYITAMSFSSLSSIADTRSEVYEAARAPRGTMARSKLLGYCHMFRGLPVASPR